MAGCVHWAWDGPGFGGHFMGENVSFVCLCASLSPPCFCPPAHGSGACVSVALHCHLLCVSCRLSARRVLRLTAQGRESVIVGRDGVPVCAWRSTKDHDSPRSRPLPCPRQPIPSRCIAFSLFPEHPTLLCLHCALFPLSLCFFCRCCVQSERVWCVGGRYVVCVFVCVWQFCSCGV